MIPVTILVLLGLLLLYCIHTLRTFLALRQFAGPPTSGLSRLWMLRATVSGKMNIHFEGVNQKYGSTARIGPRFLLTSDPAILRRMNAVRSTYTRGPWYQALRIHPSYDNITSFRDESIHARLRNQMAFGYSGKENHHLEDDVDENLVKMFDLIRLRYISHGDNYVPFDLGRITTFLTLDAISKVAFGRCFGFLDRDDDPYGYLDQLHTFLPAIMFFSVFPDVHQILRMPPVSNFAPQATDATGLGKIMGFARDVVAERFGPYQVTRKDMLGSFLSHGLTQNQLESETLTQITAGSDSSSTAIRMTLFLITTNPPVYERVIAELTSALHDNRLSRPIMKDLEARGLFYTQACIREALRLFPPVTGLLAKMTGPMGDTIDGKYVPPNTQIGWNSYAIGRRTDVFGEDAHMFRPERWLPESGVSELKVREMEEVQGLVFGYGRFGCLGKPVAMIEIGKAVPEFLLRFQLQIANPAKPFKEICAGFFLHDDFFFRCEERNERGVEGEEKPHKY